jgi:S1-C subfamily serine protease
VAVVKCPPNYGEPWQRKSQRQTTGSAFVVDVEKRRLLTNAHVIEGHVTLYVRRPGAAKQWKAEVLCEGKVCDLALLTVSALPPLLCSIRPASAAHVQQRPGSTGQLTYK